jgi:N-acyl-D-aspartate/D-glutamate deacylase
MDEASMVDAARPWNDRVNLVSVARAWISGPARRRRSLVLDLVVSGGLLVDGTGAPARLGDIGVRSGRIVVIAGRGEITEGAHRRVDADGRVVAPGFIDVHTHHDAQVFWDPACTPCPQHGVTTVIAGNCGFSVAPLGPENADYLMRMLARVESIPIESLQTGVPWNWRSTAEYFERVAQQRPAVNIGFMVGHSALRRQVMGDRAVGEEASPSDIDGMRTLLAEGLRAGGLGFSSSWGPRHYDGAGDPVPSRAASAEEIVSLCEVIAQSTATQVEFIPASFAETDVDVMVRMALAARRPLNWNVLQFDAANGLEVQRRLGASDAAARSGASVRALSYPGVLAIRHTFLGTSISGQPEWAKMLSQPAPEKLKTLSDPIERARFYEISQSPDCPGGPMPWDTMQIVETINPECRRFQGRSVGDIAKELRTSPFEALCTVVLADDLQTTFTPAYADDAQTWAMREQSWRDPRVVLGASDAGAHLGTLTSFDWATAFLKENRDRSVMPLEEAVYRVTGLQADLYGLVDRGRVGHGAWADLVVFDPETLAPGPVEWRSDLPGGAGRLYGEGLGIAYVFVNGEEILNGAGLTGARPGHTLRSGSDTSVARAGAL